MHSPPFLPNILTPIFAYQARSAIRSMRGMDNIVVHVPNSKITKSIDTYIHNRDEAFVSSAFGPWMKKQYEKANGADAGWDCVEKKLHFVLVELACVVRGEDPLRHAYCLVPKSDIESMSHREVLAIAGTYTPEDEERPRKHVVYAGTIPKISALFNDASFVRAGQPFLVGGRREARACFAVKVSNLCADPAELLAFVPHESSLSDPGVRVPVFPDNPWPPAFGEYRPFDGGADLPRSMVQRHLYRCVKERMRFLVKVCAGEGRGAVLEVAKAAFSPSEYGPETLSAAAHFLARCFSQDEEASKWYPEAEASGMSFWIKYASDVYGTDCALDFVRERGLVSTQPPGPPFDRWADAVSLQCEKQIVERIESSMAAYRDHIASVRSKLPHVVKQLMSFTMEMYQNSLK